MRCTMDLLCNIKFGSLCTFANSPQRCLGSPHMVIRGSTAPQSTRINSSPRRIVAPTSHSRPHAASVHTYRRRAGPTREVCTVALWVAVEGRFTAMRRWEGFIRGRYGAGEPQGTMRRPPSHFCGLKAYVARGACFAFSRPNSLRERLRSPRAHSPY